jgi:predicted RND superfamily exporter protein
VLENYAHSKSNGGTYCNVFYPMSVTTIAAIIGFKALSLGRLPVMKDMGTMMGLGVAFCMLAALTVVPAVLVIGEQKRKTKDR